jgi:hypothetical protein
MPFPEFSDAPENFDRISGEWFWPDPALLYFISQLKEST